MSFVMRELSQKVGQHMAAGSTERPQHRLVTARVLWCLAGALVFPVFLQSFHPFGRFIFKGSCCLLHAASMLPTFSPRLRAHHGVSVTQHRPTGLRYDLLTPTDRI